LESLTTMKTFLVLLLLAGCSGPTAAARTNYGVEEARCILNERAIVDRTGTTREQDHADLLIERARCDQALIAIGGAP
jgi:hypothetical protein